jgi:hypothetical protein
VKHLLGLFFGCGYVGIVEVPEKALIGMQHCTLHLWHRGPHQYPAPWRAVAQWYFG